MRHEVIRAAAAAVVAEVVWVAAGRVGFAAVTPLVADEAVVVAAPFAIGGLPDALGTADAVVLVLSDGRSSGRAWRSLAAPVAVTVADDPDGEAFLDGLLDQELRKHPPSRPRLDSPLLRREHWWEVPRRLVRLVPAGDAVAVGARTAAVDGVLAVARDGAEDGRLSVDTVAVDDWDVSRPALRSLVGRDLAAGEALLATYDESAPDRERATSLVLTGRLADGTLAVVERRGSRTLPPPLGLVARLRAESARKRACRDALRAAGR